MLSILMPVYNERERVERAIAEVLDTPLPTEFELIVVDDGSTDGTREILRRVIADIEPPNRVRLFEHEHNKGKGAAIQTALTHAEGEFSAIFDADLEYDPTDLGLLMPPLLDGRTNASFGVRAFDGYTSHSFLFVLGNKGVTFACNVLFNVYLHDIMTCHKMIRTDVFRSLPLRSPGFAIEPEITARLVQRGERIFEVPVHYRARATNEGKKLTALDGFRVLGTLLRCRFTGQVRSRSGGGSGPHADAREAATLGVDVHARASPVLTGAGCGYAPFLWSALACLVLAAISAAVLPTVPSYDPWAWISWGREVTDPHLSFAISGGPSWKPLPVMFTTVYGAVRERGGADAVGDHRPRRRPARDGGGLPARLAPGLA